MKGKNTKPGEDKKIVDNKGFIDKSETKPSVKNKEKIPGAKVPGSKNTETFTAKKKGKKY